VAAAAKAGNVLAANPNPKISSGAFGALKR
jgi:hypothetical protein